MNIRKKKNGTPKKKNEIKRITEEEWDTIIMAVEDLIGTLNSNTPLCNEDTLLLISARNAKSKLLLLEYTRNKKKKRI